MSQIKNIIVKDGATTPVDRTFVPLTSQNGETPAMWVFRNVSVRLGDQIISQSVRYNTQTKKRKVRIKLDLPEVKAVGIDAVPTIVGVASFDGTFTIPDGMAMSSVKDLAALVKNLFATDVAQDAIILGEIAY